MRRIDENLQLSDDHKICCVACGERLCVATENYKLHVAMLERDVMEAGLLDKGVTPKQFVDRHMVFRQFICPGCGALLENEINFEEASPIWDKEILDQ